MRPSLAVGTLLLLAAVPAHATLLEFHAGLHLGGATGTGVGGDQKDNDFFAGAKGGVYGGSVGLKVLFMDFTIEHDQLTDFSELKGTWTQFMLGPHLAFALSGPGGKLYADLGFAAGFGVGTGQQIDPPLDNAQISDKGFMLELRAGVEYRISPVFGLGVSVPAAWGYMFKNDVVNDTSNHYQTFRTMIVGTATLHLGF